MRSAQADINKRSYHKSYQEDSPETVGAQGGVLGDGVIELHSLERGGDEPKLKGCITRDQTCLKCTTIQKRLGADAHLR